MKHAKPFQLAAAAAIGSLALAASLPVHAQSSSTSGTTSSSGSVGATTTTGSGMGLRSSAGADGYSILPYTRSGYMGINVGRPDWHAGCAAGFSCSDADASVYVYTGGLINQTFGVELGYLNSGGASRNGGTTRAQAVNLSLVARMPIGAFNAFAKAGVLYGETKVTADRNARISTGRERGWGATYGVGVGYDFNPKTGVVLEWARNEFRFPGGGSRRDLDTLSLGLVRRF